MRHVRSDVFVHLVWTTWDRLPLLIGERERTVYRAIGNKCAEMGAQVIALGGIEDHIHLLIRLPPTHSISEIVGQIKGASSHLATRDTTSNQSFFKWQGGYGAFSVAAHSLPTVSAYIANQREHHKFGTLVARYEPDEMPSSPDPYDRPSK